MWKTEEIRKSYSVSSLDNSSINARIPSIRNKICPNCGYDFNTFIKTGLLGCSHCYEIFEKDLEGYINEYR